MISPWNFWRAETAHRHKTCKKEEEKLSGIAPERVPDGYDHSFEKRMSQDSDQQLRELTGWTRDYNLMMMVALPGSEKPMLAGGLCADAHVKGYKAYFRTIEN